MGKDWSWQGRDDGNLMKFTWNPQHFSNRCCSDTKSPLTSHFSGFIWLLLLLVLCEYSLWFVSLNESAPDSGGWFCRCLSCCQQLVVERSVKRILYKYAQALLHTIPTKRTCRSACLRICMRVISMGAAYTAFPCTWCIFNFSSMAAKFSRRKKIPTASSVCCDYWIWALNG